MIKEIIEDHLPDMNNAVSDNISLSVKTGSEVYGCSTNNSDIDLVGIYFPPLDDIFPHLRNEIIGFGHHVEQMGVYHQTNIDDKYDITLYPIVKFFELAREGNPNIVDVLFTPDDYITAIDTIGQMILDNRKLFISTTTFKKFGGYIKSQKKKFMTSYDNKAIYHLVRLVLELEQLIEDGSMVLNKNGKFLKDIRENKHDIDDLKEFVFDKEEVLFNKVSNMDVIPQKNDQIKELLFNCIEEKYGKLSWVDTTHLT